MLALTLLLACGTPDCDDGFGYADGQCVPIDQKGNDGEPFNWGGGVSAELFYDRLIDRFCLELARCGATEDYYYESYCMTVAPKGFVDDDYSSYGEEFRGCTVDPTLAQACFSSTWECIRYGGYGYEPYDYGYGEYGQDQSTVTVRPPEICLQAVYGSCYGDDTTYSYYGYDYDDYYSY